MKKMLNTNTVAPTSDLALLLARVGIAALMLTHGIPKLVMLFSGAPFQFPPVLGLSSEVSLSLAVFSEVICSILILVGFGTRFATIPLIATMVVAVFVIHGADAFAVKEPALHYLLVYLFLLTAGSGKFSLDYLFTRISGTTNFKKTKSEPAFAVMNN